MQSQTDFSFNDIQVGGLVVTRIFDQYFKGTRQVYYVTKVRDKFTNKGKQYVSVELETSSHFFLRRIREFTLDHFQPVPSDYFEQKDTEKYKHIGFLFDGRLSDLDYA